MPRSFAHGSVPVAGLLQGALVVAAADRERAPKFAAREALQDVARHPAEHGGQQFSRYGVRAVTRWMFGMVSLPPTTALRASFKT
jgi:hypothetical protein